MSILKVLFEISMLIFLKKIVFHNMAPYPTLPVSLFHSEADLSGSVCEDFPNAVSFYWNLLAMLNQGWAGKVPTASKKPAQLLLISLFIFL